MTATATLGGVKLLNVESVGWVFTSGTQPYQRAFQVHRSDLQTLLDTREDPFGVDLEVTGERESDNWFVHRLSVLRALPTTHEDIASVLVSDVRWRWRYEWIYQRFNVKRRTGDRRLVTSITPTATDAVLQELEISSDILAYAPYSLRPDTGYTVKYDMRDVVRTVFGAVTGFAYVDENAIYANAVPVEDITIDDSGDRACQRVLDLLPGVTCRVDEFGGTHLYNTSDGSEDQILGKLTTDPFRGSTLVEPVSLAAERPARVIVHFPVEQEVRFDFVEGATVQTDGRYLTNVWKLPVTLTLDGVVKPVGTWVPLTDECLAAIYAKYPPLPVRGQTLRQLTLTVLRQIWCNGDYNRYHDAYASQDASADPVWANVLAALQEHYRQTFQVNRRWADRIVQFLPMRLSLLDPVNNVWGAPSIFLNYALVPSYRRVAKTRDDVSFVALNRVCFPNPATAPGVDLISIKDQQASQAVLQMLDAQLGIMRINFAKSPSGQWLSAVPSELEGYDRMTGNATDLPSANTEGPVRVLSNCRMKSTHAMSIVLTCAMGAPNSLAQTHPYVVYMETAKDVLPAAVQQRLPDALGPDMHVVVHTTSARFTWLDGDFATAIENAVLLENTTRPENLLLNRSQIRDVAIAFAASLYSGMTDHHAGQPIIRVDGDLHPQGRAETVEHGLEPDGTAFTKVTLGAPKASIDVWSLMPEFVRRILRRQLPST